MPSPVGIWTWDFKRNLIFGDEIVSEYYGFSDDDAIHGVPREKFLQAIHPDDLDSTARALEAALVGNGSYSVRHRVHTVHLGLRTVQVIGRCFFNRDGKAMQFSGWVSDVDDAQPALPETLIRVQHIISNAKRTAISPSIKYLLDLALLELRNIVRRQN